MLKRWEPISDETVLVPPGLELPTRARTELLDYHGFDVAAIVIVEDKPNPISVEELTIRRRDGGPPITSEGIRKIAVRSILNDAVREGVRSSPLGRAVPDGTEAVGMGMLPTAEAERLGAAGPTPETIEWVGRIYLLAELVGDAPTKAIEKTFDVSRSTAGAWIGRARAAGHIPPVDPVRGSDVGRQFFEAAVNRFEAELADAKDELRRAETDGTAEDVGRAMRRIERAEDALAAARHELGRRQTDLARSEEPDA